MLIPTSSVGHPPHPPTQGTPQHCTMLGSTTFHAKEVLSWTLPKQQSTSAKLLNLVLLRLRCAPPPPLGQYECTHPSPLGQYECSPPPTPQVNLGNMYYQGLGVVKDWGRAKDLYRAAQDEDRNAKALLEELLAEEAKLRPSGGEDS